MALTKIRGSQIQDHAIGNAHIDPTSPIVYSNLDLSHSIVATDLSTNHTVHTDVLDYKLVALWDLVQNLSVSGTSVVATAQVQAAAVTDTATNDGSAKGVLTTGTGVNGAGIENYKIQVRDAITKDPVSDGLGGSVYGELTYVSNAYTLAFKKSDGSTFSMGAQEQVEITTNANTNNALHGKWFIIASPTAKYRIVLNYVGDAALSPLAGVTDVNAPIANNDDGATVATAIRTALNGISSGAVFTATGAGSSVVITTVAGVVMQGISDGSGLAETEFTFATLSKGTPSAVDFMFEEIYSLNSAPLKGFVTGTGFTDVVTVTGTHNHNDLYYSKSELEAGQLDDRYYTKGELNAGQLDNRYFTESELTGGSLDGRYYTETELGSTVEGSSGASKIGVSGVTGLTAGTVQGALAEIQGDINDITAGNINITLSLDDAYNDGSTITVDNTDVAWNLSAGKTFKVADGTDASKFVVSAGTGADSIKMNTTGGIDIDATGFIKFNDFGGDKGSIEIDPSGRVTLRGGNGTTGHADIGSGGGWSTTVYTTDQIYTWSRNSSAEDSIKLKSELGGLDIDTAKSIDLNAGTALKLKDANLTASLPLSQSGVAALSSHFDTATSLVGAVNENADDLYALINTTLPATTDGAAGADKIGVTGITGVIPTGGTAGANGTVQSMLEGIAMGAGGGKTFANIAAFTTAKSGGTYFKLNEPVFILDTNRWVIVEAQGTGIIEDTDWGYVGGTARHIGGNDYYLNASTSLGLDAPSSALSGTVDVTVQGPHNSGLTIDNGGDVTIITANGDGSGKKLTLTSDTETEINGGALVDINGTVVTIDGALTATGAANDTMKIVSSGTGQTQLSSETEIDLTGGAIDINAGASKSVDISSDTLVSLNSAVEVDLTAATIDLNGAVDMDGTTFDVNVTGTAVDAIKLNSAGGIDIDSANGITINENSGASISIGDAGQIDITSAASRNLRIISNGTGTASLSSSAGKTLIGAGSSAADAIKIDATNGGGLDINVSSSATIDAGSITETATTIALNGKLTATNTVDENMTLTTSGNGQIVLNSAKELNVNAPYTSIAGDVTMPTDAWLSVGNIKVTSVDPTDEATISGSRSGTVNALNKLTNSGFELGTGADAANWTRVATDLYRTNITRYYGSYAMRYQHGVLETPNTLLTQAYTGLTANTDHMASLYVFGTVGGAISVQAGTGTATQIVPAGTYTSWTRFNVALPADNPASGDFNIIVAASSSNNFYVDAVMLEEGTTLHDYFSDYKSELVMTIGDEDDDRIVFRSSGTSTKDLVRINQSTVEILGNLLVSGTTTTVNSEDMLVADNQIVLNSNVTGTPSLDAFFKVKRGTSADTAIRWNETSDKWELTTDGTNYSAIVTASGTSGLSLDSAYDGGSAVSVDNTDLNWTLAATKNFIISDATDANKFVVSAGNSASSIKIDTAGGVDIDAKAGIAINEDSGSSIILDATGLVSISAATDKNVSMVSSGTGETSLNSNKQTNIFSNGDSDAAIYIKALNGGVDIDVGATKPFAVDSGSFSIDGVLASNVSVTGANLSLSTITSGDLFLTSAAGLVMNAKVINETAAVDGNITLTTSGTGVTGLVSAQEIDLTGGDIDINAGAGKSVTIDSDTLVALGAGTGTISLTSTLLDLNGQMDFDGALFDVNVTGTGASALKMTSAGGVDIDAANGITITEDSGSHIDFSTNGNIEIRAASGTGGAWITDGTGQQTVSCSPTSLSLNAGSIDTNGSITIDTFQGGIDINAAATKPITMDSGSFSIDGVLASNVTVTGGNLMVSTVTSGDLTLASAGELVFSDSRLAGIEFTDASNTTLPGSATSIVGALNAVWNAAQGANTLDEVYDGETGTRTVTMDNGSVNWKVTDSYAFAVQDSTGVDIISVSAAAAGDAVTIAGNLIVEAPQTAYFNLLSSSTSSFMVDTKGGIYLVSDEGFKAQDDSGSYISIANDGSINLSGVTGKAISLVNASAVNIAGTDGVVTITAGSMLQMTGTGGVALNSGNDMNMTITSAGTGEIQVSSADEIDLTGGAIDINGGTNKDITVDSLGTGKIVLTSANAINLTAGAASEIKTTSGDLTVHTTGSGNELYLGDGRTGSLKLSDATHSALPNGATSIIAAIQAAYDNKGTEVTRAYHEVTASTTDVSNDYVVTNIALLPATGTFPMSPSALRSLSDQIHAVVYLNGLRLSDTEWRYSYDEATSERRITFDGSNNITLVPGDLIMIDVEKIATVTA